MGVDFKLEKGLMTLIIPLYLSRVTPRDDLLVQWPPKELALTDCAPSCSQLTLTGPEIGTFLGIKLRSGQRITT